MNSKVYFATARARRWDYSVSQVAGLERLIKKMDFGATVAEGEYVATRSRRSAASPLSATRCALRVGITWK